MLVPSRNGTNNPLTAGVQWNPRRASSNSSTTRGCSNPARYAHGDILTPGNGSSIVQAPPTRLRLSITSTRCPARARYAAHASPLCPAPTPITSHVFAASSRTGAGRPISPRTAAVGEPICLLISQSSQPADQQLALVNHLRRQMVMQLEKQSLMLHHFLAPRRAIHFHQRIERCALKLQAAPVNVLISRSPSDCSFA